MLESPKHHAPRESAELKTERLFVDKKHTEYVDIDIPTARKVHYLLKHNLDMHGDIERMFSLGDKIQGANCHKTALFLMGEYSEAQLLAQDNNNPKTAGHKYIEEHSHIYKDTEPLENILTTHSFPFRVSFFEEKDGKPFAYHSIVMIGVSNKGRLIGFDKEGPYADNGFKYIDATHTIAAYVTRGYTLGIASQ